VSLDAKKIPIYVNMSVHAIIWPHAVADCDLRVGVIDRGPAGGVTVPHGTSRRLLVFIITSTTGT
jgi:hypothetical protein